MLSIKNATIADIPLIRTLAMEIWPQTYTPIIGVEQVAYMLGLFYSPEQLKAQIEDHHTFLICYDDALPVAFASYAEAEQGKYKLHKLYILPDQQGKGIGKFIVEHIVRDLKARGATTLFLNVNRYNIAAKAFYEKVGFRHAKDEDIHIGEGYYMNDHVLELDV